MYNRSTSTSKSKSQAHTYNVKGAHDVGVSSCRQDAPHDFELRVGILVADFVLATPHEPPCLKAVALDLLDEHGRRRRRGAPRARSCVKFHALCLAQRAHEHVSKQVPHDAVRFTQAVDAAVGSAQNTRRIRHTQRHLLPLIE